MVSIHEKKAVLFIGLVVLGLLIFQVPEARAQFVLSSWAGPDDYGQGIYSIEVYENATGTWVKVETLYYVNNTIIDWFANASIKLICTTFFNYTVTQAEDYTHGRQLQRHNVTVTRPLQGITTVFSQDNLTYVTAGEQYADIWYYQYSVILNYQIIYGVIYTITVSYEVFYYAW